uniref:Conserved plasma membrane protein n=1 Tax=Rhipicephalus appendiculatus TaxID=34631 RepID=A0A131Z0L9_RHIAP
MLCFTSLFCFFYIVHGILKERYHEIAVFIFSSILLLVYLILNVVSPSQTAGASIQKKGTMLIFVMNHGTDLRRIEIIVLAVGPVVTLLGAIAGECAIRKESKVWLSIFVVLWFPNVVYIGLKLNDLEPSESWTVLYKATVACAVVALLIRLALAFTMYKVVRNFGRGLREKLSAGESLESLRPSTYYRYSAPDVGVAHSPGSGSHWDQSGRVN